MIRLLRGYRTGVAMAVPAQWLYLFSKYIFVLLNFISFLILNRAYRTGVAMAVPVVGLVARGEQKAKLALHR